MKTLCWLVLVTLLSLGSAVSAAPTPKDRLGNRADQGDALKSEVPGATALIAVVTDIDRLHGIVSLNTEIGQIVTFAAPEDLQNLHAGDQIVLYVTDENQHQGQRQDQTQDTIRA